ncbi:hypothetical protein SESBI_10377 [Sesbania bispinosa]|nr:hypothetical protein SESBI_10377 [Sesbania bispinosa]
MMQIALSYACGDEVDRLPLQPDGFCFLPNTIQARASYAFNTFDLLAQVQGSWLL